MSETGKPREVSGRAARQGNLALRTPGLKAVFAVGLAGCALLSVLLALSTCMPES